MVSVGVLIDRVPAAVNVTVAPLATFNALRFWDALKLAAPLALIVRVPAPDVGPAFVPQFAVPPTSVITTPAAWDCVPLIASVPAPVLDSVPPVVVKRPFAVNVPA